MYPYPVSSSFLLDMCLLFLNQTIFLEMFIVFQVCIRDILVIFAACLSTLSHVI